MRSLIPWIEVYGYVVKKEDNYEKVQSNFWYSLLLTAGMIFYGHEALRTREINPAKICGILAQENHDSQVNSRLEKAVLEANSLKSKQKHI